MNRGAITYKPVTQQLKHRDIKAEGVNYEQTLKKFKQGSKEVKNEIQARRASFDHRSRTKQKFISTTNDRGAVLFTQPVEATGDFGTIGSIERTGSTRGKSIEVFKNKRTSNLGTSLGSRYKKTNSFLKPARLA